MAEKPEASSFDFSIVSAVYNVADYLDEFFASLVDQTIGFDRIQLILVDDASLDDSLHRCLEFAQKHPGNVQVLRNPQNGGQAVARNRALGVVAAPWVTFTDPDDVLDSGYFEGIQQVITDCPRSVQLVSAHTISWDEATGARTDTHPSGSRFSEGLRWVDLELMPNFVHGQAPVNVFRTDVIRDNDLEFDGRLRYRFEDGKFVSQYLLAVPNAHLALAPGSFYYYRTRAAGGSSVQRARYEPETYLSVCEAGYLDLFNEARSQRGSIPSWLQTIVLYDIAWLFRTESNDRSIAANLGPETLNAFNTGIEKVMSSIDASTVAEFSMIKLPDWLRFQFGVGFSGGSAQGPLHVRSVDRDRGLVLVEYYFTGDEPKELISLQGRRIYPTFSTIREFTSFGETRVRLRIIWLPHEGPIRFVLNGVVQVINAGGPKEAPAGAMYPKHYRNYTWARVRTLPEKFRVDNGSLKRKLRTLLQRTPRTFARWVFYSFKAEALADQMTSWALRRPKYRRAFLHSWLIMDKDLEANDSGEELYRWVARNRPDVPIWFVLHPESSDWDRLRKDGFRLLAYGSRRWRVAQLMAAHMVSSHADRYITNPLPSERFGDPQWKFTFLQHGIIKGDLSGWLNGKKIDNFVTSTRAEHDYIAGSGPYKFSERELVLSGLPRHDALLRKSELVSEEEIDQLLIAPTWRQHLVGASTGVSTVRERNESFATSDFAKEWKAFLHHPRLHQIAQKHGLRLVFLPHPNLAQYRDVFTLPSYVETREFGVDDIQDVVSRSAAMVTDYSSAAFNMAYLYRPTAYFQFDQSNYTLNHTEGEGYFNYEEHGFGPVASQVGALLDALDSLLDRSSPESEVYFGRAQESFPVRDGRNTERVYDAIVALYDREPPRFADGAPSAKIM